MNEKINLEEPLAIFSAYLTEKDVSNPRLNVMPTILKIFISGSEQMRNSYISNYGVNYLQKIIRSISMS